MATSDLDRCYFCDATDDLEEHHIVPQRFRGGDGRQNLVTLCHDCHWKLERLYNKDFYEALGVEDPRTSNEKHVVCDISGCPSQAVEKIDLGKPFGNSYLCKKHLVELQVEPNSDPMDVFREYPDLSFDPENLANWMRRTSPSMMEFELLERNGMIEKVDGKYTLPSEPKSGA